MEELLARGRLSGAQTSAQGLFSATEAQRLIEGLRWFTLEQVGSPEWIRQHSLLDKLNLQAHFNAQKHADEFVVEALSTTNKLTLLVRDMLVAEIWKQRVLPLLFTHVAAHVDSVRAYLLLYHEAAVANLLEVALFHRHACESMDEDALLELCDWCFRKLLFLHNPKSKPSRPRDQKPEELLSMSPEEDLRLKQTDVEFGTALCAITILRYLTDHIQSLPLSVSVRLVSTNDALLALVPLLDAPPWQRVRKRNLERWAGGQWLAVDAAERLRLSQHEAQVWLTIYNLICDPAFAGRHGWTAFRREAVGKLRGHLNEILQDQLPVLRQLQRVVDEMSLGGGAPPSSSRLILEQVPTFRDALLSRSDWEEVAEKQRVSLSQKSQGGIQQESLQDIAAAFDFMCDLEEGADEARQGMPDTADVVKVQAWRQLKPDVFEPWSTLAMQIDRGRPPEDVQLTGEGGATVRGQRYRLKDLDLGEVRPLAPRGKVSAIHEGRTVDALLDLPAPETRDKLGELPQLLWATIGLLATDGFALQIKLKRAGKEGLRDRVGGVWCGYQPAGGAITLRTEMTKAKQSSS